jgi:suppressor of ftsI/bilirubin oxidase
MNRRQFLKTAGFSGMFVSAGGVGFFPPSLGINDLRALTLAQTPLDPRQPTGFTNPLRLPAADGLFGVFEPSADFTMTAKVIDQQIIPGTTAKLSVYEVEQAGRRFLNPTFKLKMGADFRTTFANQLSEDSIIHWHGFRVDGRNDGHPGDAIRPGTTYPYNFRITNRAATYWYHPHPDGITARQVYFGLAGFFIVEDGEEVRLRNALDLILGDTDIPLVIQDRRFNSDGTLAYNPNRSEFFMGILGNVILVNQTVKPVLDVSTRVYRFRVLNGSNSRNYRLAFLKGSERLPFYIIGNDGGLLDKPYPATEAHISAAERVDLLLDMRNLQEGEVVFLKSLGVRLLASHGGRGDHSGHFQSGGLNSEDEFFILRLNVQNRITYDKPIPEVLSEITPINTSGAPTRPFLLSGTTTQWFINGFRFSMNQVPVSVNKGTTEVWEITNALISMPHPMHVHGFLFQVLERINSPVQIRNLAIDSQGRLPTDKGWKDTALVWPGEKVRIAIDFSQPFSGAQLYVFHCHILEHEDGGMMINYQVV